MNKRFDNKSDYDPGRFRFKVTFEQQVTSPDGSGGFTVTPSDIRTLRAVREKLSEGNQLAVQAGASLLTQDCYFVIRKRPDFYPEKDMFIKCDNMRYNIRAIIDVDVPVKYVKIICAVINDKGVSASS